MEQGGTGNEVAGIYIDLSGKRWEGIAICVVEETPTGRLVIVDSEDPNQMRLILTFLDGPALEDVMRTVSTNKRRIA